MELEEITTSRLNYSPKVRSSDQTSSRFINRFIRLKTTHWNRQFAINLLTFIGGIIQYFQCLPLNCNSSVLDEHSFQYGMCIGYILGGILVTIYPTRKMLRIFGISYIISFVLSICNFMEAINISIHLNAYLNVFSTFCMGTTMAIVLLATLRICTFWMSPNKWYLRYTRIVLWMLTVFCLQLYTCDIKIYLQEQTVFIGLVGLAWFVLWLYVIIRDYSSRWFQVPLSSRSSTPRYIFYLAGSTREPTRLPRIWHITSRSPRIPAIFSRWPTISKIPWKSFCTSKSVISIVLSFMCYTTVYNSKKHFDNHEKSNMQSKTDTTIFLLLFLVLVELVPEIIERFSDTTDTNIRKIFGCTFFFLTSIVFFLDAFTVEKVWFSETKTLRSFIFDKIEYFLIVGSNVNHLDIAPKYAIVLYGFQLTVYHHIFPWLYSYTDLYILYSYKIKKVYAAFFVMAVIYLAVPVYYAISTWTKIQSYVEDEPEKYASEEDKPEEDEQGEDEQEEYELEVYEPEEDESDADQPKEENQRNMREINLPAV